MDYKKIIKSQSLRRKLLRILSFVPDKPMVNLQYKLKTGRKLNLNNPKRYTEKLQWYKLYYKNPLMVQCVDKYDVREYVKSRGLEDILIPCYGIYDSVNEIDWNNLPERFVIKDTLGGGGVSVIVVKDIHRENLNELKNEMTKWTKTKSHVKSDGREWPYYSGKGHRILLEEYIDSSPEIGGLRDYKFFCFDGEIYYVYVISNRVLGGHGELAVLDKTFKRLPYQSATQAVMESDPEKPENYDYMLEVAQKLSTGFPHVRVDLYNVDGRVLFGELTFFGASGYQKFIPDEFDFILGQKFNIEED